MARKKPCQTGIALASHPYGNRFSTAIWQKAPHSHLADGSTGAGTAIWQAPSHLADGSTGAGTGLF